MPCSSLPDTALFVPGLVSVGDSQMLAEDVDEYGSGPLKGARYGALTAPGPSGMRAEHLKKMLSCPRRSAANSLTRSLARLHGAIDRRELPEAMRWLTRSRLFWQKKKSGKPRPIKMGELLRSTYAKRLSAKHMQVLRPTLRTIYASVGRWHPWCSRGHGTLEGNSGGVDQSWEAGANGCIGCRSRQHVW